eukprot:2304605-Rhodomonas_salina.1
MCPVLACRTVLCNSRYRRRTMGIPDMLSALTTTIKMEAVFKYLKPVLINGEVLDKIKREKKEKEQTFALE